ncbi:unnamed protein product [Closterium sp. NIES-54]
MAARIASKSRSKIATPALDSSPQRGDLCGLRKLVTPSVRQAAKAAVGGVHTPTLLTRAVAGAEDVGARTSTPTPLACSVPLTELLRGGDVTRALLLLLALTTTGANPRRSATPTSSTSSATASSTAATPATSAPTWMQEAWPLACPLVTPPHVGWVTTKPADCLRTAVVKGLRCL